MSVVNPDPVAGGPLEKDACRDYVLPRLHVAGWSDDQIVEQFPITDGRVITVGAKHRRGKRRLRPRVSAGRADRGAMSTAMSDLRHSRYGEA